MDPTRTRSSEAAADAIAIAAAVARASASALTSQQQLHHPSGGGGVAPNPPKKLRTAARSKACDSCHRFRRRCDFSLPVCGTCIRMSIQCTYMRRFVSPDLVVRRGASSSSATRDDRVIGAMSRSVIGRMSSVRSGVGQSPTTMRHHVAHQAIGVVASRNTCMVESPSLLNVWLDAWEKAAELNIMEFEGSGESGSTTPPLSRAATVVEDGARSPLEYESQSSDEEDGAATAFSSADVPDEEEAKQLIDNFFRLCATSPVHLIHEGTFRHKHEPLRPETQTPLTLAMCAVSAACGPDFEFDGSFWPFAPKFVPKSVHERGDVIFHAAISRLDLDGRPTVDTAMALLLLALYCDVLCDGRLTRGWILGGMALRLVPVLKLDVDPDDMQETAELPWVMKEMRRRLFRLICDIDQFDMIYRERHSGVSARTSSVKPFATSVLWDSVNPETGEPSVSPGAASGPLSVRDATVDLWLRVTGMSSRIVRYNLEVGNTFPHVGPAVNLNWSDKEGGRLALLERDLLRLQAAVPAEFKHSRSFGSFSLCAVDEPRDAIGGGKIAPYIMLKLHLNCSASMLLLHRPRLLERMNPLAQRTVEDEDVDQACGDASSFIIGTCRNTFILNGISMTPAQFFNVSEARCAFIAACHIWALGGGTLQASEREDVQMLLGVLRGVEHRWNVIRILGDVVDRLLLDSSPKC